MGLSAAPHRPAATAWLAVATALGAVALGAAGPGAAGAEDPIFTDATAATGLDFHHFNGASGEYYFPEITGAGGALFDADGDGDLDLYLVQGALLGPGKVHADALFPARAPLPLSDRLYRNDLSAGPDGRPRVRFTDVTAESGLAAARGYGMGVAVGDYDGDGRRDLYVTNFGSNQMWRNRGVGAFEDVTAETGTDDPRWSVPAAFADFDRDGRLDLFVGNYVDFGFAKQVPCLGASGARDYCGPKSYPPVPDRLFLNRGAGAEGRTTFEDVTGSSGIGAAAGPALGAVVADVDGDGWIDVYVANDGAANFLWIHRGAGAGGQPVTFEDEALFRGCALNADGRPQASMGVDFADVDGDGDEDLFMTHLDGETNTLYLNDGGGTFRDASLASGLATPSWNATGFGTAFLDVDNDGWLDVVAVNGAVKSVDALRQARDPFPYHQPDQLFRNLGPGSGPGGGIRFEEVTERAGPAFARSETGRGALVGDLDNDGDTDLVINNNNGPARLLLNQVGNRNAWVGLALVAGEPGTEVPGTRVEVLVQGRPAVWRRVRPAAGFASSVDPRVLVGLGTYRGPVTVRAHWPDGRVETWAGVASGRYTTLRRGSGDPVDPGYSSPAQHD